MPESAAGGAAFLNGQEIVNDARTIAYLEAGYGPTSLRVSGGCACPRIRELIECDSDPYTSPISDPAPWYDSSVPESADFAGFLTTEFEGLGSTYTRANIDKITGGAVLGRLRPLARTLTWRGLLFGRSDSAVQFGLRWLTANLRGTNCNCGGEDLDILISCPQLTATPPEVACDSLPAIKKPDPCPPFAQPDAFRTLKNVGLLDGPKILSQRRMGCTTSCGSSTCPGETLMIEVEFSLLAGNPYLFGCAVCLAAGESFPINEDLDCNWVKVIDGGSTTACGDAECPPDVDCTTDTGCPEAKLPDIPAFQDQCFCDPVDPVQFCCPVPADSFGQFFDGAPVIEIFSGSKPMRATTIRFFSNPQGLSCCDVGADPCLNCDSVQIRFIPANSTMLIDGTTRTVTVQCKGMGAPILADHLTVTPFAWPILQCADFCICIETEGTIVATDATVTVLVTPREM